MQMCVNEGIPSFWGGHVRLKRRAEVILQDFSRSLAAGWRLQKEKPLWDSRSSSHHWGLHRVNALLPPRSGACREPFS
jgi:hypothetical protein